MNNKQQQYQKNINKRLTDAEIQDRAVKLNSTLMVNGEVIDEKMALAYIDFETPIGGGIALNPYISTDPDVKLLLTTLRRYFSTVWEYEGVDKRFTRRMEKILFDEGSVAIVKLPDGEWYPTAYVYDNKLDTGLYDDDPIRITAVTDNNINNMKFKEGEFFVIHNNTEIQGTLRNAYERIRQTTRALRDVYNASTISAPKIIFAGDEDDRKRVDVARAYMSKLPYAYVGEGGKDDFQMLDITPEDRTQIRIMGYRFLLADLLQFLGLKVNDGDFKAERQTENEIARGDKFDNLLMVDMDRERADGIKRGAKLGCPLRIKEPEIIYGESEKDEVNGEVNKKIMEAENEKNN